MTSRKSTKYELFSSIMALILCCAMLIGTTFSWFTDSASNTGNRILSGKFKVDLLMDKQENGTYASIKDGTGDIFSEATGNGVLWEPNKTEIVYLAVKNEGNLALKYNVLLDVQDEGLAGALQYAILDGATAENTSFGNWEEVVVAANGKTDHLVAGDGAIVLSGRLDDIASGVENEMHYFALAVHMNQDADDSYQEKSAVIDVKVQATQADAEADSFGTSYDASADFTNVPSNVMQVFYVNANGAEDGTGEANAPFNTIQKAIEAVRTVNDDMTGDILVYIADGEYYVDETIALGAEDSGSNGYDVIYKAQSTAGVRLYGAEALTGWTQYTDTIWSVPVEDDFYTLYEDDRRAIKARYPNREYDAEYTTSKAPYLLTTDANTTNKETIKYNINDLSGITFEDITDANIVIWPWNHRDWSHFTCGILSVDKTNGIITPNIHNAPYGLNARYYIEGMLELLDAPGEFHYDSEDKMLYYMPMNGGNPNEDITVYAPVTQEFFHVTEAQNIVFDGISFEKTDFLKHMSIWYNNDESMLGAVVLDTTKNVDIINCQFKNIGLNGVWITGVSSNNTIDSCLIENIGINGVLIRGDRANAEKLKDNVVSNCLIHDVGELSVESGGVTIMSTQGTVIENCEFYNSPRNAVSIRGNASEGSGSTGDNLTLSGQCKDNIIRNCLIYETNQDSGDTGALHTAGISYPTANGNTNYFENIYVDNIVAHPSMKDAKPNGYFGDYFSNHQSFKNVKITNAESAKNSFVVDNFTDMYQIRYNDTDAATGIYENASWVLGFEEKQMDFVNMGLREDFPFELTADYTRVKQAVILQVGSEAAIVNGTLQNAGAEAVEVSGTVLVPVDFLLSSLGLSGTQVELSTQTVNGQKMTSLAEVEKLGVDANNYDGLIVISKKANLFDPNRDDMTLKRLGNYLFENYQAKNFKYDVIESAYTDYTLTGTELKDGESYMVRSAGSWNATSYAVSKADGKVRLIIKEDNYGIPVYTELSTAAASVSFVRADGKLKVIVDNVEVYNTDNPFDAVYYGTYTEDGTNTLNAVTNGMSILPEKATDLGINVGASQIMLDGTTRYYVTLKDEAGNTYDITEEAVTVTSSNEAVAKCENGYVIPVAYGKATLTANATIDGEVLTASVEIEVIEESDTGDDDSGENEVPGDSSILFKDTFDSEYASLWFVKNADNNADSYAKVNAEGKLEVYDGSKSTDTTKQSTELKLKLDDTYKGEVLSFEFDYTPVKLGNSSSYAMFCLYQDYDIVVSSFGSNGGQFAYYLEDGTGMTKFGECVDGQTYHVKIVSDSNEKTVDFYIDGVLLKENVPWRKQARTYVNGIGLGSNSDAIDSTFKFDNVVISKVVPVDQVDENLVFKDTFDSEYASLWFVKNADNNADSYAKVNAEGKLEVYDGSKSTDTTKQSMELKLKLDDTYKGEVLSFEFDYTPVKLGNSSSYAMFCLYQDYDLVVSSFGSNGGQFAYYLEDGTGMTKFGECVDGQTYHVKIVSDSTDKTVDFYIDGVLLKENVPWRKQARTYVNGIGLGSNSDAIDSTFQFDNVVISKVVPVDQVDENLVFKDTFDSEYASLWFVKNTDNNADSYAKVNAEGQLEVYDGSKSTDTTKQSTELKLKLDDTYKGEVVSFEFDYTPVKLGNSDSYAMFCLYQDYDIVVSAFGSNGGQFAYYLEDGTGMNKFGQCIEGQTYHVKMVSDSTNKTVDFYIDGVLLKENIPWRKQSRTYVNGIGLGSNSDAIDSTFKFDNVVISKVK